MMTANLNLLARKFDRVIAEYAKERDIPLRQALDEFYKSNVYLEMRDGISDMHCRSDAYLAEELRRELGDRRPPNSPGGEEG
jgi:hypothetical protein